MAGQIRNAPARDRGASADALAQEIFAEDTPARHIGQVADEIIADLRIRRAIERLQRLGPRAIAELLMEIGAVRLCFTDIEERVERYARLGPDALTVTGGDRFPASPIREIG